MNTRSFLPGLGGALLIGCIVACSDSTSPNGSTSAFDAQVTNDIAPTAAADVSSEALFYNNVSNSSFSGSFSMSSFADNLPTTGAVGTSAIAWIDRNRCFADGLGAHIFGSVVRHGFWCHPFLWGLGGFGQTDSVTYQVFKTDTTTDSVQFAVNDTAAIGFTWNSITRGDTAGRHRNATLILRNGDTVHVWNGVGSGTIKTVVERPNDTTTYMLTSNDTTTNLTFYVAHNGHHRYPMAGTIVRNYTVTLLRQGTDSTHRTTTRRVVVTFDSTATPTMTINGNASFSLNLQSPQSVSRR